MLDTSTKDKEPASSLLSEFVEIVWQDAETLYNKNDYGHCFSHDGSKLQWCDEEALSNINELYFQAMIALALSEIRTAEPKLYKKLCDKFGEQHVVMTCAYTTE